MKWLVIMGLCWLHAAHAATRFEDITLSAVPLTTGDTQHGYLEHRIAVQNESPSRTHQVTVILPDRSYNGFGNNAGLHSLSRTVTVGPNANATISLWQPALPVWGDNNLRVLVDGRERGTMPSAHNRHGGGGRVFNEPDYPRTLLVSRTLNSDDLDAHFKGGNTLTLTNGQPYFASQATGAPNSAGQIGLVRTAWVPAQPPLSGEWLKLDYATPIQAKQLRVFSTRDKIPGYTLTLYNASGAVLSTIFQPHTATNAPFVSGSYIWTIDFPLTSEPVSSVRLELDNHTSHNLGIDAVELVGPTNRAWASSATANSYYNPGSSGTSQTKTPHLLRAEAEVSGWSEQWLSYTPFDAVIVKDTDFMAMSGSVQNALWRYAECGGALVVLGKISVPEPWAKSGRNIASTLAPDNRLYDIGFGRLLLLTASDTKTLVRGQMMLLNDALRAATLPWITLRSGSQANAAFPVVEDLQIPVRGLVFLMFVFVLGIGPINLWILHRKNKRIWLLWTVPAISFGTCALLFIYSIFSEGITAHVRTEGLTLLDQVNHRATTLGMTGIYAPLTPNGGLRFSYDTEVTALTDPGNGGARDLDWSEGQHLARGWVTARVPAHFQIRKSETRRERITVENTADGKLAVVNGLGATMEKLWVADTTGKISAAFNLAPGQRGPLTVTADTLPRKDAVRGVDEILHGDWGNVYDVFSKGGTAFLRPGTYIATLSETPFIEKALGGKAPVRARQIVYGILESSEVKP